MQLFYLYVVMNFLCYVVVKFLYKYFTMFRILPCIRSSFSFYFQVLDEVSVDGIVDYIKKKNCKNIITMAGAGISTCK